MASTSRPLDSGGFISAELKNAMLRLLCQAAGVLLAAAAVVLLITFIGYDASDGSLNSTALTSIQNPLGVYGAIVADVVLQTIGTAAYVLAMILFVWGLRLLFVKWRRAWLKLACLPMALLTAAAAMASIEKPESWPFPAGMGGFAADLILTKTSTLMSTAVSCLIVISSH